MIHNIKELKTAVASKFSKTSADTLGWLAILSLHAATVPSLLAVMSGLTDKLPSLDLVLLVWTALVTMFLKAAVQRDMLNLVTIGLGFVIQSTMLALIFFK